MKSHHLSDRVRTTLCLALAAAVAFGALAQPMPASAQAGGTIEGLVFADLNGDGQSGPDEPGLPGIIVRLTDGNNTSKTLLTGMNGSYVFGELEPGEYDIKVETGRDFQPTTLASYDGIAVGRDSLTGLDFGLKAETAAAEAIVDQAIDQAEADAAATEEAMDEDAAEDESMSDAEADEADEADDADVDADAGDDADADDNADADADEDMHEGEEDSADTGDADMYGGAGDDGEDDMAEDAGDSRDDATTMYAGARDDGHGGAYGVASDRPVDEMPGTGFEDLGVSGLLAALAFGMAALAAAGVWRERSAGSMG